MTESGTVDEVKLASPPETRAGRRRRLTAGKVLGIAVLIFVLLEALIFRSGLYARYVLPKSYSGEIQSRLRDERRYTPPPGERQILLLGDSRVFQGFSAKLANEASSGQGVRFVDGSARGSTLRVQYYLARALDPDCSRYDLIVIGISKYGSSPSGPLRSEAQVDISRLALLLGYRDLLDFPFTFKDPELRAKAAMGILFKGWALQADVQAFLSHPGKRLKAVRQERENGLEQRYNYRGRGRSRAVLDHEASGEEAADAPTTADGPTTAEASRSAEGPAGGDDRPQKSTASVAERHSTAAANEEFGAYWLGRFASRLAGTRSKLMVIQMPRPTGDAPGKPRPEVAEYLRRLEAAGSLVIGDAAMFESLERPEFFFDKIHLNAQGRERFTKILTPAALQQVSPQPSQKGTP